jgi:hypothetical protein
MNGSINGSGLVNMAINGLSGLINNFTMSFAMAGEEGNVEPDEIHVASLLIEYP